MLAYLVRLIFGLTIINIDGYNYQLLKVKLFVDYIRYNVIELFYVYIKSMNKYKLDK